MFATTASVAISSSAQEKVPNGTIRPIVQRILAEHPGITTAEAGRKVLAINPVVTAASVTNELNRNSPDGVAKRGRGDVLYEKVGNGWHLTGRLPATDDAQEVIPAPTAVDECEKDPEAIAPRSHMNGVTSEAPVTRLRAV